jgi:hypothetical protein
MEIKTIDLSKPVMNATLGEAVEALAQRLEKKEEKPISTPALKEHFGVSDGTIAGWHKLGMPKMGYNRWMLSECVNWHSVTYPKIVGGQRKPRNK